MKALAICMGLTLTAAGYAAGYAAGWARLGYCHERSPGLRTVQSSTREGAA